MTTVLVTGANGLVGQAIVKQLEKANYTIVATSKNPQTFISDVCLFECVDLTNISEFEYIAGKHKPDVIVHCAALSKPDECEQNQPVCWKMNVEAVETIARYCEKNKTFLVYMSSDFVFSGIEGIYDENVEPYPVSFYGRSKFEGENIVRAIVTSYAIIRTSLVYGTVENNIRSNFVLWVRNALTEGKQIKVVADQYRTPTYNIDIAKAINEIIDKKTIGIYNIAGKDYLSVYDIAIETAEVFGLDKTLITPVATISLHETAKRPPKTFLKIDKAYRDLHYAPLYLSEGLNDLKNNLKCT